eukprot:227085-Rhodomonas_salina.2
MGYRPVEAAGPSIPLLSRKRRLTRSWLTRRWLTRSWFGWVGMSHQSTRRGFMGSDGSQCRIVEDEA